MTDNNLNLLKQKIRDILLNEWDPISIRDIPEAQDEYDSYIFPICQLLVSGKSNNELFEYLWWAETEHIGLPGNIQHTQEVARKLHLLMIGYFDQ